MSSIFTNKSIISWILLVFLSVVWGSSYILIKKGLIAFDPVQLASLRLMISALAFLPVFLVVQKKVDWSQWRYLLLAGLMGNGVPAFLFAFAQTKIGSALAGILNSLTPLATFFVGFLLFGLAFRWHKLAGVVIGLIGAFMLIWFGQQSGAVGDPRYAFLILGASVCYAVSSNVVASRIHGMGPLVISAVSFFLLLPLTIFFFFGSGVLNAIFQHPAGWTSFGYVSILALSSTVMATILFYKLLQLTGAVFGSLVSYLVPVVATFWGILDGEHITILSFSGMLLILLGVYITKTKRVELGTELE